MWAALYTIADKYGADVVMESLRDVLIPQFLDAHPLRVYALASHWGLEEEVKIASRRTLRMNISEGILDGDVRLMGAIACQKLYHLHLQHRDKARTLVSKYSYIRPSCSCPAIDVNSVAQAVANRISTTPWLTAEELYEVAAKRTVRRVAGPVTVHIRAYTRGSLRFWMVYPSYLRRLSE